MNRTFDSRNSWLNTAPSNSAPTTTPSGGTRSAWSPQLRDTFVEGWRGGGGPATTDALRSYVSSAVGGGNFSLVGADRVRDSQGRTYDLINNVGTSGASRRRPHHRSTVCECDGGDGGRTGQNAPAPAAMGAPAPAGPVLNTSPGLQPSTGGPDPNPAQGSPFQTQLREILMAQLGGFSKTRASKIRP